MDSKPHLYPYHDIFAAKNFAGTIALVDHLGGFDQQLRNSVLDHISNHQLEEVVIQWQYFVTPDVAQNYPSLKFEWDPRFMFRKWTRWFTSSIPVTPGLHHGLLCCFNNAPHISRQMILVALYRMGLYDPQRVSKNFEIDPDKLDGNVTALSGGRDTLYTKWFVTRDRDFLHSINQFPPVYAQRHNANIENLVDILNSSWVNIVTETMGTSYYPYVTEKFLYSVMTQGLFVAWAPPGWHRQLEDLFGFKLYPEIFDYSFDLINNPCARLMRLLEMVAKFRYLSHHDRHDLWYVVRETREYNRQHFLSGDWQQHLSRAVAQ